MSTEKLAWLAGMIDGEGSLRIYRQRIGQSLRFFAQIHITNTNLRIIAEVKSLFDALGIEFNVREIGNRKRNPAHAPCYSVRATKNSAMRKLLSAMLPYLVGKRDQAETVLKFLDGKRDGVYRGGSRQQGLRERDAALYASQEQTNHPKYLN